LFYIYLIVVLLVVLHSFSCSKLKTTILLNSRASTCFVDEEFVKCHKFFLIQKPKSIHVEVIDEQPLSFVCITHETVPLEVTFEGHSSHIIFNVIKTPSNRIIIGLFWLKEYNPSMD